MSAGPDVKTAEDETTDNQRIKTSLKKYLRYALLTLLWGAVAAYVIYAGTAAGRLRAGKKVGRVEIEVVDSSSMGYLVSRPHGARVDRAQRNQDERHGG